MQIAQKISKKMYLSLVVVTLVTILTLYFNTTPSYALVGKINTAGEGIVQLMKDALKIVIVVMLGWMGYSLIFARTAEGLADLKGRIGIILLCMLFILGGDWIYTWVSGFFA